MRIRSKDVFIFILFLISLMHVLYLKLCIFSVLYCLTENIQRISRSYKKGNTIYGPDVGSMRGSWEVWDIRNTCHNVLERKMKDS